MGSVVIGSLLCQDATYYSSWETRQGDGAVMACEVLALSSSANVGVVIATKNTEESDAARTTAGNANGTLSIETIKVTATGIKELWRFEVTISDVHIPPVGGQWAHVRSLPVIWLANGA